MKKIYKNLIIFFISLIVFLNLFTLPVQARDYSDVGFKINSANYDVTFMENGDVKVIEHWELEYYDTGNTFNERFISKYSKSLAKRTTLTDFKVYIGENICTEANNSKYQKDYTYNIEENEKGYRVSVFISSQENDIRQITLSYTLKDLVKSVENEYYYINFEPTPYSITQKIKELEVTFRLHNEERISIVDNPVIYPIYAAPSRVGNNIKINVSNLDESKLTTILKITNNCFDIAPGKVISKTDVPFKPKVVDLFLIVTFIYILICVIITKLKGRSLKVHLTFKRIAASIIFLFLSALTTQSFIICGLISLFLIGTLFSGFKQEDLYKKHEKNIEKLQRDSTMLKDIVVKYRNIVDYRNMLDTASIFSHLSFFARLVDAHQRRLLNVSENGTVIFELKEENKKDPIFIILAKIKKYCDKKHIEYTINGEKITFTIEMFKEFFEKPDNYKYVFDKFHPLDNSIHSQFNRQEKDKQLRKEFEEDFLALASLSEVLNEENISFKDFLNTPLSPDTYIAFLQNDLSKKPDNDKYNIVDLAMYEIYKKHVEICTKKKRDPITGDYLNGSD